MTLDATARDFLATRALTVELGAGALGVSLRDVEKSFARVAALRGVSLDIPAGRALALVGPNGSGKTTLIRVIVGLLTAKGSVVFDGRPRSAETAARMAYVPQAAPVLAVPVSELVRSIAQVRDVSPDLVFDLARHLGLDVNECRKKAFRNLSGGQKQKLLLAMALAPRAGLLVLDEPTASLDAESRQRFFELFSERRSDSTLILCSHRLDEIRHLVDHVVMLADGAVAYDGPAADYLSSHEESLIEMKIDGGDANWLVSEGFSRRGGEWWTIRVPRDNKLETLRRVSERLGSNLVDVTVHDFERLDPVRKETSDE
jgi:ABC-type multidrug transport system ATPase subunit